MMHEAETEELLLRLRATLEDAGLRGSYLVRDVTTGQEVGIDADRVLPVASLAKVPLALAVLERMRRGELDGARRLRIEPGRVETPGPTGVTRFRHVADIALEDALSLSVSLSDNAASDALLDLIPPDAVMSALAQWGVDGIAVRHRFDSFTRTPVEALRPDDVDLAHAMAIGEITSGGGHRLAQLDVTRANAGTARALVNMLVAIWSAGAPHTSSQGTAASIDPVVAGRVRELMAANVHRHRLAPDFSSDASRWSSKTATLLNLRHEIGVVEHADGAVFAIAALTESRVAAATQPGAEAVIADVARQLRDHLRTRGAH